VRQVDEILDEKKCLTMPGVCGILQVGQTELTALKGRMRRRRDDRWECIAGWLATIPGLGA